jgi:Flp pilus assembly protein TadG
MTAWQRTVVAPALLDRFAHFRISDSGNMTILAFGLFMAMTMMGGLAIDLMRYEATRTQMQQTLDRSVLAAASLTQQLDPKTVVADYFSKAGLAKYLTSVNVQEGINFRSVKVDAKAATDPIFMHMMGISEFDAAGSSSASERHSNVEISLVLDISGSMKDDGRITAMKAAATDFVQTVLSNDKDKKFTIQIVPFNGKVNLGAALAARYNLKGAHNIPDVNCIDLPPSVYSSTGISTTTEMTLTSNADSDSRYDRLFDGWWESAPVREQLACAPSKDNIILLPTNDLETLRNHIRKLDPIGGTSINVGMKWGLALLDPGARNMFAQLRIAGIMDAPTKDRPFNYNTEDSLKIVILMTDGENTDEEFIGEGYKFENSPIWLRDSSNQYSAFHESKVSSSAICASRPFWVPHLRAYHSRPWNGTFPLFECYVEAENYPGAKRQTWPEVWSKLRVKWVVQELFAEGLGWRSYKPLMNKIMVNVKTPLMNDQLAMTCNLAKANGVVVYGIAFEAPRNGQSLIKNCATSNAHYFEAKGLQIKTAFRTIADNIGQLRLTQ